MCQRNKYQPLCYGVKECGGKMERRWTDTLGECAQIEFVEARG